MDTHVFVSTESVIDPSTGEVLYVRGDKLTSEQLTDLSEVYGVIYVPVVICTDYVQDSTDHSAWVVKSF
jgi:hypothetical protein